MGYAIVLVEQVGNIIDGSTFEPGYVESADPEAHGGRGEVAITVDPAKALKFASPEEALEFWARPSTICPTRSDGEPNRPLTAFTMKVVPL